MILRLIMARRGRAIGGRPVNDGETLIRSHARVIAVLLRRPQRGARSRPGAGMIRATGNSVLWPFLAGEPDQVGVKTRQIPETTKLFAGFAI